MDDVTAEMLAALVEFRTFASGRVKIPALAGKRGKIVVQFERSILKAEHKQNEQNGQRWCVLEMKNTHVPLVGVCVSAGGMKPYVLYSARGVFFDDSDKGRRSLVVLREVPGQGECVLAEVRYFAPLEPLPGTLEEALVAAAV